ncbi:hypothetical protein CAPTEDRAFT_187513 [Capitella teleta]|uniref:Uncharacterized protein n=1 Tax=Capitella teleta TaxID=283909 RepID=R7TNH2_CAPTE|nr:hypothetical protein CAPTEDRAFT_187513 [Capitella teleta]|eukprot:ELT95184.1 hypothetical protein CAPTEDRAFT_187513 [Capitella teleta]
MAYIKILHRYKLGLLAGAPLYEFIEAARRKFYAVPLYAERLINSVMENNIATLNAELFDPEGTSLRLITTPKSKAEEGEGEEGEACYTLVESSTLVECAFANESLIAPGMKKAKAYPYYDSRMGSTRVMRYLSSLGTPICMVYKKKRKKNSGGGGGGGDGEPKVPFFVMGLPCSTKTNQRECLTLEKMLSQLCRVGGTSAEMISSENHLSVLVFDVDLVPDGPIKIKELCQDMETLANLILHTVPELKDNLVHYFFYSTPSSSSSSSSSETSKIKSSKEEWRKEKQKEEKEKEGVDCFVNDTFRKKYGIHHHIRLPKDIVMTCGAAEVLVHMLNEIRFLFPETIGRRCPGKEDVYDPNIYKTNKDHNTWHALRLPYQTKPDGSKTLLCVHRTDGKENDESVPVEALFAHSPKKVVYGSVIKGWEGRKYIDDKNYIRERTQNTIDAYVQNRCQNTCWGLMEELNARSVMFTPVTTTTTTTMTPLPSSSSLSLLLDIVNELWEKQGKQKMRAQLRGTSASMPSTSSTSSMRKEGFKNHCESIEEALHNSRVIAYEKKELRLVSPSTERFGGFALCPVKWHKHHPYKGVELKVVYHRQMIRFGFVVSSFKPSCQNQYLHAVTLSMRDIFLSAGQRRAFEQKVMWPLKNTAAKVMEICWRTNHPDRRRQRHTYQRRRFHDDDDDDFDFEKDSDDDDDDDDDDNYDDLDDDDDDDDENDDYVRVAKPEKLKKKRNKMIVIRQRLGTTEAHEAGNLLSTWLLTSQDVGYVYYFTHGYTCCGGVKAEEENEDEEEETLAVVRTIRKSQILVLKPVKLEIFVFDSAKVFAAGVTEDILRPDQSETVIEIMKKVDEQEM